MISLKLYDTFQRQRTLRSGKITALPVVILMPNSSCNCRCVMCDIWRGNKNAKRLTEEDISGLLESLKKLRTRRIVMSGGEALLHPNFFRLCEILKKIKVKITLLSTGLTVKDHLPDILEFIDDLIVSLDGDEETHDIIRNIPGAFNKLKDSVYRLKQVQPGFRVSGRSVIHRYNFRKWAAIIDSAHDLQLDRISFLAADVSSHAFNREILWDESRQQDVLISEHDLPELQDMIQHIISGYSDDIKNHFIAESAEKIQKIHDYYAAYYGLNPFPPKKCNAPWVSAVIEPDGQVKPCFFHGAIGSIRKDSLSNILNSSLAMKFRNTLDTDENPICKKCVCYLHLRPQTSV